MKRTRFTVLSIGAFAFLVGMLLVFSAGAQTALAEEKTPPKEEGPKKAADPAKKEEPKKAEPKKEEPKKEEPKKEEPKKEEPKKEEPKKEEGKKEPKEVELPSMVVTATRTRGETFRLSRFVTLVNEAAFSRMGLSVAVDALEKEIGTWVEHRTGSTGDPVIRGLSGGNLLALVDGCSLSSFWGEGGFAGDDMYGKIDPETVDRIEVVRGPGSVMYGSQALGAVMNFITRSCPLDFAEGPLRYGGRSKLYFTAGNSGFTFRNEGYVAHERFRALVGSTVRHMGDMRGGGDVGMLRPTSSQENNWDAKLEFLLAKNHIFTVSHQNVYRDPTNRYYRPTQENTNIRQGYMARYHGEEFEGALDEVDVKVYHQYKADR
ncbi:MAG: TonB-dependent receptor plug domain-containing protein, partial [Planctomycetota bacterium]